MDGNKILDIFAKELDERIDRRINDKLNIAEYDKSYNAIILGVNQDFTDDVTEEEQQTLINKYSIPEVPDKDNYYTFKINGNYYVRSSNTHFNLYENVKIRIPNGSWDNMYIEVQRDTITEGGGGAEWFVSVDEPTEGMKDGDYWVKLHNNESITKTIKSVYKWSENDSKWNEEYSCVGAFINEENNAERFNHYYPVNPKYYYYLNAGSYSHAEGYETFSCGNYSHAEGYKSETHGEYAHVEGNNSRANGDSSHAEGSSSVADGKGSHAEGCSKAIGNFSHAEGDGRASGNYSHAEGDETIASNLASHAEGYNTTASGNSSHAEGSETTASGDYSHAEGYNTTASGNSSHAEGLNTKAEGKYSHAEGTGQAYGKCSHAEGSSIANGEHSHAEGYNTIAEAYYSHAEGSDSVANGLYSHAEGKYSHANGQCSHAEGSSSADGNYSHSEGEGTIASGIASHTSGKSTIASYDYQSVIGAGNLITDACFVIGNGRDISGVDGNAGRSNAFFVRWNGSVWASGSFQTDGGDYTEPYEWVDKNSENEDRAGLFVTLDGYEIKLASSSDLYILGVVSAVPSIVGKAYESHWKNKYKRDIFERYILDSNGNRILSEEYDSTKEYIPRSQRPEKAAIGTHGQLIVIDDGTCEVNGYCSVADGGIGTRCDDMEKVYRGLAFRVLERLDETHIRIVIK